MATFHLEEMKLAVPLYQYPVPEVQTTLWHPLRHLQMQMEVYLMKCIIPVVTPVFSDK